MATENFYHHLPDTHFTQYLKKRDAMVARAVIFRLRKKLFISDKKTKVFYAVCSTSSFPPSPSYVSSLNPVTVSATAWVSTYLTSSTLIRSSPTFPPLVRYLDSIETTECVRTFKQKVPLVPPQPVQRSKKLSKIKKAPLTKVDLPSTTSTSSTTTTTTTTTSTAPPLISPSNLSRVLKTESNPDFRKFFSGKQQCSLHICNSKHRCPKAPPWPPNCIICGKQCKLRARVCNGCGVALCMNDSYVGVCPHPGL